jgi:hypothetical protein
MGLKGMTRILALAAIFILATFSGYWPNSPPPAWGAAESPKNWLGEAVEFSAASESPMNLAEAKDYCQQQGGRLPLINGASYLPWAQIINPKSAFIDGIGQITTGRNRPADWATPWPAGLPGDGYWTGTENGTEHGYSYCVYDEGGVVSLVGDADPSSELRVVCIRTAEAAMPGDGAEPPTAPVVGGHIEAVPPKYDEVGSFSEGLAAVMLDGKWGFMAVSPPASLPVPAPTAEPDCYRVNIESGKLRVRECSGGGCEVIGELERGDEVCPTQITGDWAEFPYGNGQGHVFAKYLSACPRKSGPLQTLEATFWGEECGDFCWVTFRLANGDEMRLQGTVEEMALKEGARVSISYQEEQFWWNLEVREESMCVRVEVLQSVKILP